GPAPDARGQGGILAAALPRHGPHRRPPRAARAWRRLLAALAARVHAPSGELDAGGVGRARHPHRGAQLRVRPSRPEGFRRGSAVPAPAGPATIPVVSVGPAIEGHEITIVSVSQDHTPLPERKLGQIWIRGPSISPWYFEQHHVVPERRTSLRTGDVGYLADG